jgi:hypothetical protein
MCNRQYAIHKLQLPQALLCHIFTRYYSAQYAVAYALLFLPNKKYLHIRFPSQFKHFMPCLVNINPDVQMGGGIGGYDFDYVAALHFRQGFFQAQQRQWAQKAAGIHFQVKFDEGHLCHCYLLSLLR